MARFALTDQVLDLPPTPDARGARARVSSARARMAELARAAAAGVVLAGVAIGAAACDGTPRALDAATTPSARMSALSLRIDVAPDQQPTLTALAFRAAFSGVAAAEVLGLVDPLASPSPARDCQLRDLDSAAALAARGDGIELEELAGVGISTTDASAAIRPSPRLYPDVAPAIGGVVSEAGPLTLGAWPEQLHVTSSATADASPFDAWLAVPSPAQVTTVNGIEPTAGASVAVAGDLNLGLAAGAAADSTVELRPYGATVALICRIPAGTGSSGPVSFVVSRQLVTALVAATGAAPGGRVAASLDLVRRQSGDAALSETRIAVEVRTSTVVELRP